MSEISIAISVVGLMGSISSILFAYLAFKRNEKKITKKQVQQKGNSKPTFNISSKHLLN